MSLVNKRGFIVPVLLTIEMLSAHGPWPIWGYFSGIKLALLCLVIIFFCKLKSVENIFHKSNTKVLLALLLYIFYFVLVFGIIWFDFQGSNIVIVLAIIVTLCLSVEEKERSFALLTKSIAVILLVSLPAWLVHKYVSPLPLFGIIDIASFKGTTECLMYNYFWFVSYYDLNFRFYSVFDEPGALGTLAAFVLYANRYDFKKWYNVAILVCCIPTYSLAFYALTLTGMAIRYAKSGKVLFKGFIIILAISALVFYSLQENEMFQEGVVYRVTHLDESADDRIVGDTEKNFKEMLNNPITAMFGYGDNPDKEATTSRSYKNWLLEYGFVGLFVGIILYLSFIKNKKGGTLGLFFLLMVSFIQRPNNLLDYSFIPLFLISINHLENYSIEKK